MMSVGTPSGPGSLGEEELDHKVLVKENHVKHLLLYDVHQTFLKHFAY